MQSGGGHVQAAGWVAKRASRRAEPRRYKHFGSDSMQGCRETLSDVLRHNPPKPDASPSRPKMGNFDSHSDTQSAGFHRELAVLFAAECVGLSDFSRLRSS